MSKVLLNSLKINDVDHFVRHQVRKALHYSGIRNYPLHNNINKEKRFIFIHIPKTAGTSLRIALGLDSTSHYTYNNYQRFFPIEADNFLLFSFVRNPIDRFISLYNYAKMDVSFYHSSNPSIKSTYGKHEFYDLTNKHNINAFIDIFLTDSINLKSIDMWKPQANWLINSKKSLDRIDFIGKYENLPTDVNILSNLLNIKLKLDHFNKSQKNISMKKISPASIKKLQRYYQIDYEMFNY